MKYDLIIIGSGSVGAAAGYYATRAGLKVLMTDAHMPPHQQGSHHGDTRLIRHAYGEGEKYVPLMLRAQTLWDELSTHNEEPIFCPLRRRQPRPGRFRFLSQRRTKRATVAIERRAPGRDGPHDALAGNSRAR